MFFVSSKSFQFISAKSASAPARNHLPAIDTNTPRSPHCSRNDLSLPTAQHIPRRLFFLHQSRHPLPEQVVDFEFNFGCLWQLTTDRGFGVEGVGVVGQ